MREPAMSGRKLKILLTGRNGQVGMELERRLPTVGDVFAFGRREMDLLNPEDIRKTVDSVKPDIIVNPAAYTSVDEAEKKQDIAMAVNGIAPGVLAEAAKKCGALLVHYSTDYVFDGKKGKPYTEEDEPNPLNFYGKTKLAGERAVEATWNRHLIIRSSWIYGSRGNNFLLSILELARGKKEIRVVDDQIGSPTSSRTVACASQKMLEALIARDELSEELFGTYHVASTGSVSRSGFAEEILSRLPKKQYPRDHIIPIRSDEYPSLAGRPKYSVLDSSKAQTVFGLDPISWSGDLALVMEELNAAR